MACGPGRPELSQSYMVKASTLVTLTFIYTFTQAHLALYCCMTVDNAPHLPSRMQPAIGFGVADAHLGQA